MSADLSDNEIEDRFFLRNRMEVVSQLQVLAKRHEPLTAHFNGGRDFILTTLLDARPEGFVFDLGGSESANDKITRSESIRFVGAPDGIRTQWSSGPARRVSWGNGTAFWCGLPEKLVRLQRREYFRILTPVAKPVPVKLNLEPLGAVNWTVHDLSVGGLGVNAPESALGLTLGTAVDLMLLLPDYGRIDVRGKLAHSTPRSTPSNKPAARVGIEFLNLSRHDETAMQKYIVHVEKERKAMTG